MVVVTVCPTLATVNIITVFKEEVSMQEGGVFDLIMRTIKKRNVHG